MGIEPTYPAWKAGVLPLNYTRTLSAQNRNRTSDTRIFSPLLYQLSYLGISNLCVTTLVILTKESVVVKRNIKLFSKNLENLTKYENFLKELSFLCFFADIIMVLT